LDLDYNNTIEANLKNCPKCKTFCLLKHIRATKIEGEEKEQLLLVDQERGDKMRE
jgi:hypothetical protein